MSSWFQELSKKIEKEAERLAKMEGTMEDKEKHMMEVSFPRIMEELESKEGTQD